MHTVLGERVEDAGDVGAELREGELGVPDVAAAVGMDAVPGFSDRGEESRAARLSDLLGHDKEGGRHARAVERVQYLRRPLLIWPVVEGQRDRAQGPAATGTPSASATATWQATCLGPIGVGRGVSCEQVSMAWGQRKRKRQPSVGLITRGGSPLSAETASAFCRGSATAERSSCVYGCFGSLRTASVGPSSTRWPAYITTTRSAT